MRLIGPRLTTLLCALLFVLPAHAGEKKEEKPGEGSSRYLNISPVAAPIVVNGVLVNYVFLTIRIELRGGVDVTRMREREPYFRDALVRAAHRHPFVIPGDYTHVDEAAVKRSIMADSVKIAGPNTIAEIKIINAQPQKIRGVVAPPASSDPARTALP